MTFTHAFSTALFASLLSLSLITACDDGGDEGTDEAGDGDSTDGTDGTDTGADVTCDVLCESFITLCLQTQKSTEFETLDACTAACASWDQAGINCRSEQIGADMCDQAGNMGSACN